MDWASRAVLLAAVEHDDAGFLRSRLWRRLCFGMGCRRFSTPTQGAQFTRRRVHRQTRSRGNRDFDGRARPLHGQHFHRTAVALDQYEEIHLKAYADGREARAGISSWMTFYNFPAPTSGAGQSDADGGLARGYRQDRGGGEGCGYAASLGQRKRVAPHTHSKSRSSRKRLNLFLKDKSRRDYTLSPSPRGPANGVPLQYNIGVHLDPGLSPIRLRECFGFVAQKQRDGRFSLGSQALDGK